MKPSTNTSRVPEKRLDVSGASLGWTLPVPRGHREIHRSMRRSQTARSPVVPRATQGGAVRVEVRVTVVQSTWRDAMLFPKAPHAAPPELIVSDTRQLVASLGGGQPPPLSPRAFKATPNRALLDALLDLTLEAVKFKRSP